jgi:hypothetical protein
MLVRACYPDLLLLLLLLLPLLVTFKLWWLGGVAELGNHY